MKLFTEIQKWLRQQDEDAAAAIADPVRDGKFAIEDARKQVGAFTTQIAKLVAGTKELQINSDNAQHDVDKFERIAIQAGNARNADDVKEALQKKAQAQTKVLAFQHEIEANNKLETALRTQLTDMQGKIDNAQTDYVRLGVRISSNKIRTDVAKTAAGVGTGKGLAALNDLADAANKSEAEAEAYEDIAHVQEVASGADLLKKYDQTGNVTSDEIAKYMPTKTA